MSTELADSLQSAGGFRNQLHVGMISQKADDPLAKNRMVVDRQNPD
jgi:hypothetical protein